MKRVSLVCVVLVLLVVFGAFVGCGYQWKPLSECAQQSDCPQSQRCVRQVCRVVSSGTCTTNADCVNGVPCVAQRCTPARPEVPGDRADAGPDTKGPQDQRPIERPMPPDVPNPDAGPDAEPDAGPDTTTPENPTPEGTPDVTHTSPQGPVRGCLAGSTRSCRYAIGNKARKCKVGSQMCLFDGTWSPCGSSATGGPNGWYTPAQYKGEFCGDDEDNNCNGAADEGCYNAFDDRCQKIYVLNHTPIKANELHPAFLTTRTYSPRRQLLLERHTSKRSVLSFYEVDTAALTKKWLLDLPPVGGSIHSYDISADGSYVAAAAGDNVIVWKLQYTTSSNVPHLQHFGVFPVKISRLGFRNVDDQLVFYKRTYDSKKRENIHRFESWEVRVARGGQLELSLVARGITPAIKSESFSSFQEQPRLGIHPGGGYVVFHSYNYVLAYTLPAMKLIVQIKLEFPPDPENRRLAFHAKKPLFVIAPYNYGGHAMTVDMTLDVSGKPKATLLKMYEWANGDVQHLGFHPRTNELHAMRPGFGMFKWADVAIGQSTPIQPVDRAAVSFAMPQSQDLLFIGTSPAGVRLISTTDGKELLRWNLGPLNMKQYSSVSLLELSPNGKTLFVMNRDSLTLWDIVQTGGVYKASLQQALFEKYQTASGHKVAFSKDGKWLAWSYREKIHVWNKGSDGKWKHLGPLTGHSAWVYTLAWHPTKPLLVSGGGKGELRLWSFGGGVSSKVLHTFKDTKQNTLPLVGTGFFAVSNKPDDTFILATLRDGTTYAFSLMSQAPGGPKVQLLPDTVVYPAKTSIREVKYDDAGAIGFSHGDGGGRLRFQFSAPDAKGQRKFSLLGRVADLTPVKTNFSRQMQFFLQRSATSVAFLNDEQAFFWRCKR